MTASMHPKQLTFELRAPEMLLGSVVALALAVYAFASGWLNWSDWFRAQPYFSLPCTFSLFAGPILLYVSVRRMTEVGMRMHLLFSALTSAAAISLTAVGVRLWVSNLAG